MRRPITALAAIVVGIAVVIMLAAVLTACGSRFTRDDNWTDDLQTTCRNGDRIYAIVTDEVDGLAVIDDDPTCRTGGG